MTKLIFKNTLSLLMIILAFAITACSKPPQTTDVDFIGKQFIQNRSDFEFKPNCKKPKAFRGVRKYKVDCIVSIKENAWEETSLQSHSSFFYMLSSTEYKHIGSTSSPGVLLKPDNADYPIQVFHKPTRIPGCFKRLYIDTSNIFNSREPTPAGTRLIIADPWVLSCASENK